jgi:hypothetical protein
VQEGTGVHVRAAGAHTVEYWSIDRAANEELPHHTATFSVTAAPAGIQPVFRFYRKSTASHFYTASGAECDSVVASLWGTYSLDGVAYTVNTATNHTPLFRFYNLKTHTHFYTASVAERDSVKARLASTYRYEGIAYYIAMTPGATPVYRFYNIKRGFHFYTASEDEKNSVRATLASVYRFEGPAFYVAP